MVLCVFFFFVFFYLYIYFCQDKFALPGCNQCVLWLLSEPDLHHTVLSLTPAGPTQTLRSRKTGKSEITTSPSPIQLNHPSPLSPAVSFFCHLSCVSAPDLNFPLGDEKKKRKNLYSLHLSVTKHHRNKSTDGADRADKTQPALNYSDQIFCYINSAFMLFIKLMSTGLK